MLSITYIRDLMNILLDYYGRGAGNSGAHIAKQARTAAGVAAVVHIDIQSTQEIGIESVTVGRALAISRISNKFAVIFAIICVRIYYLQKT